MRWAIPLVTCACLGAALPAFAEAPTAVDRTIQLGSLTASDTGVLPRLQALLGIAVLVALCWLGRERLPGQRFPTRIVVGGLGLQLLFAAVILKTPFGEPVFSAVNHAFVKLMSFSNEGARFLFGQAMDPPYGLVAFAVLPTIIFFSSLMSVGYHTGLMVRIVRFFSKYLARALGTSGAETLSATGNIFVGQTESPLMIRPFLPRMTRSELHCVMVGGFATVAGGVMAAYVSMLSKKFPDIAGHLLAASIMSAPAALMAAKLLVPETERPATEPGSHIEVQKIHSNVLDAAAAGASDGLTLALNVGAMLLAFIALVALANAGLSWAFGLVGFEGVTLQALFGYALAPVAWLLGVPASEAREVGALLGVKTVLNEFVAYLDLARNLEGAQPISHRSAVIVTYALCGFANFSSIAIQIGGIAAMVPERRRDLASLGLRAMIGGSVAAWLTGALAGLFV